MAMAVEFAERAKSTCYAWKWVVFSVHTAVQVTLVFASREGKWERTPESKKGPRMHAFNALLARHKAALDVDTFKAATRLNGLRDEFAHFKYDGWSLDVDFASQACGGSLPIIDKLLIQSERRVLFWPSLAAERRFGREFRLLRKTLVL